jgi:hypothetical protein
MKRATTRLAALGSIAGTSLAALASIAGTSLAALAVTGAAAVLPGQSAEAAPYWRCPAGWSFRVNSNGSGAHCHRKVPDDVAPISCPNIQTPVGSIGTFQQAKAGRDVCAGETKIGGITNRTEHPAGPCVLPGSSYRQDYQGNTDRCVKTNGQLEYRSPTAQFESTP